MATPAPGAAPVAPVAPRSRGRRVAFPDDDGLVTSCLEPPAPFAHAEEISAQDLLQDYIQSCQKHNTPPIERLIEQIKERGTLGGSVRHGILDLAGHQLSHLACEALESIFKKTRFQRIDIHNCSLNDDAAIALFDMIEYYESTVELDISGNKGFGILAWKACSKMISQCQWLEQLEIRETSLSESSAPVLGRGLRSLCSLRSLHLEKSCLSGPPLLCLAGVLKQNKSIRELRLGDNNLVTTDARHLASMLKINSSLQFLDVSNNDIQDSGIEAIAEALAEQSSKQSSSSSGSSSESSMSSPQSDSSGSTQEKGLVALIVWNNNLTRNSGKHFSKALARCHSLEMLNIGQNPLCNETVNRLRSGLQKNRSLLSLGMQSTRLGPEAAVALAEVIEDNPVIQRIDLRDNKLQAAGLLALATALKKNKTVTRIDLDDAPPIQADKEQPLEEARLVEEIRSLCNRNEAELHPVNPSIEDDQNMAAHRKRIASFTTRKISLTCQTLHTPSEPVLSPPKAVSRIRSPLPSPIPSPIGSPIPSPLHRNRFQVSRVSDSSSGASQSPSPSTPPGQRALFGGTSRFKVVSVSEPPSISVQAPDSKESSPISPMIDVSSQTDNKIVRCGSSRFSIVRNVNISDPHMTKSKDKESTDTQNVSSKNAPLEQNWMNSEEQSHNRSSAIKKNKSESSLDSPDLEVSRFMQHQEKRTNYDSSSSLDISGSSMESLNTLEINTVQQPMTEDLVKFSDVKTVSPKERSLDLEENDVFDSVDDRFNKKLGNLSLSSNESSLDLSAPVDVPQYSTSNQGFLNSSVSSNESVSPNIFGKHMKLHGSITSLEASVSSLDSFKSGSNVMISPTNHNIELFNFSASDQSRLIDSTDSGIFQSDNSPKTLNSSMSSNDGTLTGNSNLSKLIQSFGSAVETPGSSDPSDVSKIPKRTSSLLDVPSSGSKQRNRKISWVASPALGTALGSLRKDIDDTQQKPPSSLEKLLNLFQIPTNIFSRNVSGESNEKRDSNSCTSLPSTSGSFWPWGSNSSSSSLVEKMESKKPANTIESMDTEELPCAVNDDLSNIVSSVSAEYTIKLADRRRSSELSISDDNISDEILNMDSGTLNMADQIKPIVQSEEGSVESKDCTGTVHVILKNAEISADGFLKSINRISNEKMYCDNFDRADDERDDFVNPVYSEDMLDEAMNDSISMLHCDNVNVQLNRNLTEEERCADNVTVFSTIPNDSIITKNPVQNNLLLSICDNDCRSPSVICGSQNDDECTNTKLNVSNAKVDDVNTIKNISPEKDLLCNIVRDRERVISRDLSICSATSSINDTDTDNSPNTFDCCIIGSDNLLFNPSAVPPIDESRETANNQEFLCKIAAGLTDEADDGLSLENLIIVEEDVNKSEDIPQIDIESETKEKMDEILPSTDSSYRDILTKLPEPISETFDIGFKNTKGLETKSDKNPFSCEVDDFIKPANIAISRNAVAANFSLEVLAPTVLKQSIGIENISSPNDRQQSPESGPSVENLPIKIIKRIKENISPENTLTTSMSNTQALAQELSERRKMQHSIMFRENLDVVGLKNEEYCGKIESLKKSINKSDQSDLGDDIENNPPVSFGNNNPGENIFMSTDDDKAIDPLYLKQNIINENLETESNVYPSDGTDNLEMVHFACEYPCLCHDVSENNANKIIDPMDCRHSIQSYSTEDLEESNSNQNTDFTLVEEAKDALTFVDTESDKGEEEAQGHDTHLSALEQNESSVISNDLCLNVNENSEIDSSIPDKDDRTIFKPISILKNSKIEDKHPSSPKDIPDKGLHKSSDSGEKTAQVRCGSLPESMSYSPKSLPDSLTSRSKMKSRSPINTLGKLARDSLYGLNMSEEEICELKESTLERVRSLGSVSEDGGDTFQLKRGYSSSESRSLGAFTSQESLASLTSISETAGESDSVEIAKDSDKM